MDQFNEQRPAVTDRRPWESPELKTLGTIAETVQGGMGKFSAMIGDPGEPRKPSSLMG